mgnify:CR=1 FL=1
MTIRLQDTLTGEVRPLEPLEPGHVRVYSCGPTVYGPAHVGNFRSFLFADLLVRYLRYRGLRPGGVRLQLGAAGGENQRLTDGLQDVVRQQQQEDVAEHQKRVPTFAGANVAEDAKPAIDDRA